MVAALILSSVASGIIATAVMTLFLYLPLLWGGVYYDTLGSLGALATGKTNGRSRLIGTLLLFLGGIVIAVFYGLAVLMFEVGSFPAPDYVVLPNWPVEINLFYPLMGLILGLGQAIFVSLTTAFIVSDVHPVQQYREPFPLMLSYSVGHLVYGASVIFFQHQLLQLLLA